MSDIKSISLSDCILEGHGSPEQGGSVTSSGRKRKGSRNGLHAGARSRYFALLLYPDNPDHMDVLDWIQRNESYVLILHQPEDDDKKPHYHLILHFPNARTLNGVQKYFAHEIDSFIRVCTDPYSFIQYMMHNTYECKKKNKSVYSLSDLQGTAELIRLLVPMQKQKFTESIVTELVNIIEGRQICYFRSLIKYLVRVGNVALLDYVVSHSYFVRGLLLDPSKFSSYGESTPEQQTDDENLPVKPFLKDLFEKHFADSCVSSDPIVSDYLFTSCSQEVTGKFKK